jgi:hypothetical protein
VDFDPQKLFPSELENLLAFAESFLSSLEDFVAEDPFFCFADIFVQRVRRVCLVWLSLC